MLEALLNQEIYASLQGEFLKNIGLDLRREILKHENPNKSTAIDTASLGLAYPQQMGEFFKAMAIFSPIIPKPTGFES